jgi:SAM-dependent methyltransferase
MSDSEYVLGTDPVEIERLGLQHRIWRPYVLDAWQRAGIGPGCAVVDLGCGPGHASLDLAREVGPAGRVIAVDQSRRFLDHLERRARDAGLSNVHLVERDLDTPAVPLFREKGWLSPFFVWCRWVLAFVRDPRLVLAEIAGALAPGDTIVLHEYYDYAAWQLMPRCRELEEFVAAVMASWRATGGEPDVGLQLPGWLTELGLEITSTRSLVHVVPPDDPIWEWPAAFLHSGTHRLAALGALPAKRGDEIRRAFDAAARQAGVRLITPAVLEVIARSPSEVR